MNCVYDSFFTLETCALKSRVTQKSTISAFSSVSNLGASEITQMYQKPVMETNLISRRFQIEDYLEIYVTTSKKKSLYEWATRAMKTEYLLFSSAKRFAYAVLSLKI